MLNQSELQELLLQFKAGTLGQAGRDELEKWAAESAENMALLELLGKDSQLPEELKTLYAFDQSRVWQNISQAAAHRRRRTIFGIALRTAAAAAVLTGTVLLIDAAYRSFHQPEGIVSIIEPGKTMAILQLSSGERIDLSDKSRATLKEADATEIRVDSTSTKFMAAGREQRQERLFNTIIVPKGSEYPVELSDGTKVWLNAESTLTFPTQFDDNVRRVELTGEAYFEVKSDPKHPFIVKTERLDVEVLGTSFNIMTYGDEPMVETTLISGSLKVCVDKWQTMLEPGMQAQFDRQQNTISVKKVHAESYAAWSKQMFVFFDEPIESICRKLARWYDVEIDATSARLKGIRYSGIIKRSETFNNIADLMSSTDELLFREVDGRMKVDRK